MLNLDNVTLLGIDCVDIERLIFVSEISQIGINFKEVKLLTHLESNHKNIVKIEKIDTIESYSRFMIKELYKYVDTDYVLIIQHDGFVLNPKAWRDSFLEFDYIGAPSLWGMGNGGFSLRSKKLLDILGSDTEIKHYHPEDRVICETYKSYLESKGIKFATSEIAHIFSVENDFWKHQFGFHNADISSYDIEQYTSSTKNQTYIQKFKETFKTTHIKLTYIVHFYLQDNQYDPIQELIDVYSSYDKRILDKIHFVFVDDHSEVPVRIREDVTLNYTLLRITDDITWNQSGARNLGVKYAKSKNIILTDLDITFPENLLSRLLYFHPPNNSIFKFHTISGLKPTEPHFNVFFMNKDVFNRTRGVDEEFGGYYGYEDVFFYFLNKALGTKFYLFRHSNIVHREHKEKVDTQHNKLVRNMDRNEILFNKKMEIINSSKVPLDARSDVYLNFDWEVVQEHERIIEIA